MVALVMGHPLREEPPRLQIDQQETITGVALLKQTGDEVTGSIGADERNQHPLDGVVKRNRITLTTHPRPGRTVAFDKCDLNVDGEKMRGTTERKGSSDKGTIEFVRMKE